MSKSKIFIASSGRTLELAKQLRARLNPTYCEVDLWTEVSADSVGRSILEMLKEATKKYDFAIVILARDDVLIVDKGDKGKKSERLKARDNCVFEAGLFVSALGEERCFLVTSVDQGNLPSDLSGIIYIAFTEPTDINDPGLCQTAVQVGVVTSIEAKVRKLGPVAHRPLSAAGLLEKQRRISEGGELLMDQVVVASVQPEVDHAGAQQVRRNIDVNNVTYVYLFQGNKEGANKTCQLLQAVLLADKFDNQADAEDWLGRLKNLKKYRDEIRDELQRICREERIKIFFLPAAPAMQYCIHNATDDKNAKWYLKRGNEYVAWESGRAAYDFWTEVRTTHDALHPSPQNAVFYGVPGFNETEGNFADFLKELKRAVNLHFPEMADEVMSLCYPGPGSA